MGYPDYMTVVIMAVVVVITAFAAYGAASYVNSYANGLTTNNQLQPAQSPVTDYGSGLLKFQSNPQLVGTDVSSYMINHPDLKLISVAGQDYWGGYWVVVENRSVGC